MSEDFTPEEIQILSRYVTNPTGDTFCVNIPGLAGIIYARYSRAVTGMRRTLLKEFLKDGELNVNRTQELIERILNEYGDDSVGELEGAHLALEQVSNLMTKVVEDARIGGSPIEQSTRYVFYDQKDRDGQWRYYKGKEILESSIAKQYLQTMDFVFDTYSQAIAPLTEHFQRLKPISEAEYDILRTGTPQKVDEMKTEALAKQFRITYNADLRTKACDVLRCLLPASTLTNVGLFGNGRFYQGLLTRLYSSNLPECSGRAGEAHTELNKIIPKFVKRALRDPYTVERREKMAALADSLLASVRPEPGSDCSLLPPASSRDGYLEYTLAMCLYADARHPLRQLVDVVRQLSYDKRSELLAVYTGNRRTRRDRPGRAFEYGYPLTFEIEADFGAYRDLQRHRMLTQERQLLHPGLGYEIPEEMAAIQMTDKATACFERSADLHSQMKKVLGREIAQYGVLFGFKIRWMMGMNLREAMHMIELRTTPQGHPSYRKICQNMMAAISREYPEMASTIQFADLKDYYWSRAESEARQRARERNIDQRYGTPEGE
jgi:thymidylate synthase ThyX